MTGEPPEPGAPAPEAIRQKARTFVLQWMAQRQGSPAEPIRASASWTDTITAAQQF
jgi:hypothetical protein